MKRLRFTTSHTFLGFSLVELLVTVSIISILIAIGIASYSTINKQSRDAKRKSDLEQIRAALEMYRADNGFYPTANGANWISASDPAVGLITPLVPTYIAGIPRDPKSTDPSAGQNYMYLAKNAVSGVYYGYCVSAQMESENPEDTCTDTLPTGHTYGLKNP